MVCIFCGNNNVYIVNDKKYEKSTINCNDCYGKYYFKNNKKYKKWVIKYPKGNINPIISMVLMLLIIPIGLIFFIVDIKPNEDEELKKVYFGLMVIYANAILIPMIIFFFQGIYNFLKHGFMVVNWMIVTNENSLFNKCFTFLTLLLTGFIILFLMLYMNISYLKYIF